MKNHGLEKVTQELKVGDKIYNLVFDLNVMQEIQEKYGSFDKWIELTDGEHGEVNVGALKFSFMSMINEGIDIENETAEKPKKFLTEKQVGRLITEAGLMTSTDALKKIVVKSTESDEKNA